MRVAFLVAVVALLPPLYTPAPQSTEEEAIKAAALAETKAFFARDAEAWQSTWLHDASVSRTIVSSGSYAYSVGWDEISAPILKTFKEQPEKITVTPKNDRFSIRRDGNIAWLEYVQQLVSPDKPTEVDESREQRMLVKTDGTWKIASQVTHVASTFGSSPAAIENTINNTGYALLAAKKPQEAIDVFQVNVKLYPQSWNAYDSLGEAYMEAGQKDLAIRNYESPLN